MTRLRHAFLSGAILFVSSNPASGIAQQGVDLPAGDRPLSPAAQDVYAVGALDGAEWETFSGIGDVAFDGSGNLYILDGENFRVVVVRPDGSLLREVGHEGGGPGEFRNPAALAVRPDGSMVVFDLGNRALISFDPAGEFTIQRTLEPSEMPGRQLETLPDGSVVSASGQGVVMMVAGPEGPSFPTSIPIRRYPRGDEGTVTTMHEAWLPPRGRAAGGSGTGPVRMVGMPRPKAFEPSFAFGTLPDGRIVYSDTVTYSVKILDGEGPDPSVSSLLRRPIRPRPVTRRDRDREKERRLARLQSGEGPQIRIRARNSGGGVSDVPQEAIRKMLEEQVESLEFAEEFPVISDLAVDWRGRIWVERTAADYQDPGPIDLLSADGAYLGTIAAEGIRIPDAFGPDGLAAYVETGELEVPVVVVRRLSGMP